MPIPIRRMHLISHGRFARGNRIAAKKAIEWMHTGDCRRVTDGAPETHCNLGNILRVMEPDERREDAFRRAVEAAPGLAEAHVALADLLRRSGRREEAVPFGMFALASN